jgi:regulator of sirC expression with transglutaminase-like and TPR domain
MIARLEDDEGGRLIFDPAVQCEILQAPQLRQRAKKYVGPQAELSATYYEPLSGPATLVRLQNIVKLRQIEIEDYQAALDTVRAMRRIDPGEYRLLLDEGVLCDRTGRRNEAEEALEDYLRRAPNDADRREAAALLRQIKGS